VAGVCRILRHRGASLARRCWRQFRTLVVRITLCTSADEARSARGHSFRRVEPILASNSGLRPSWMISTFGETVPDHSHMKCRIPSFVFLLLIAGLAVVPVRAMTVMTEAGRHLSELRDAMRAYGIQHSGAIPYGENAAVISCLKEIGVTVPPDFRGPNGELLDPWKNPFHFLRCGGGSVLIMSFGPKSGDDYFSPECVVVSGTPFEAKKEQSKK